MRSTCLRTLAALLALTALAMSACAPRQTVRPIPADTPPARVLEMAREKEDGITGVRAMVKVAVRLEGQGPQAFDAVLYAKKPDKVRLTGLAFMGYTVFDMLIRGDKFYFYQPSEGYLYTGHADSLPVFLEGRGVKADPAVMLRSLFFTAQAAGDSYMVDATGTGYDVYLVHESGGVFVPEAKTEYDLGLGIKRRLFYDRLARPYLSVETSGYTDVDGHSLPSSMRVKDVRDGYVVDVTFEKYLIEPEGLDEDFSIQGGEFKGIREVE